MKMKSRFCTLGIVSLVVFMGLLGFITFETEEVSAQVTLYVGGTGPGNFSKIQDAINVSTVGDTVIVYNGTYYENIEVNRTINLTGEHMSNTTINGKGAGDVVRITSNWVNITGFTITNGNVGIHVLSTSNNSISDNNVLWNTWEGIWLDVDSNSNLIKNNTISSNGGGGITTYSSMYNNITNNNLTNDGVFVWGDQLSHFNTHSIPDDNTVNGEPVYYYKNTSGIDIDGIPLGQLILANCTNFNINSLEINKTDIAVEMAYSQYVNINDNNLTFNSWSNILLYSSDNNNITDNEVTFAGEDGMVLSNSNRNNITGNNVTFNAWDGILLKGAQWNYITHNNVSSNTEDGIHLDFENTASIYNEIAHNEISSNVEYGIHFNYSGYNNITYNDIMYNSDGIFVDESSRSIITDNNITDNNNGVLLVGTSTNFTSVANNNISSNSEHGVSISASSDNDIIDNDITDYWRGIYVFSSESNNIIGNEMPQGSEMGIWLMGSSDNDIVDNNVSSNYMGICLEITSSYNNVTDNNASNNDYGIYLGVSSNNNITNNNVTYCGFDGISLQSSWSNNIIDNNASNNSHSGIYLTASGSNDIIGNNASGNADSGINLTTSDGNDIIDNDMHLNDHCGIELDTSNYNTISNNTIWDTTPVWQSDSNGIYLRSSDHNTISGNNASYHQFGIYLDLGSTYNDITENEAYMNGECIKLGQNCDYNNITDNRIVLGYAYCIYLIGSSHNTITGNYIFRGSQGITLLYASEHNTISYNEVVRTGVGIETYESWYNDIEHNNLTSTGILNFGSSYTNVQYNDISDSGILIGSTNLPASQNQIRNNNITNSSAGIWLWETGIIAPNNNWIVNNRITDCNKGVYLSGLPWCYPFNNYVIDNTLLDNWIGIHTVTTQSNTFINNTMTSCGIVIEGDGVDYWDTHVITTNNTVNGKSVYYWKNIVDSSIPLGAGEVILVNCMNVTIENQELTQGSVGIELGYTTGIKIDNVNVSGNSWVGMFLWESSAANITNSEVFSTGDFGIWVHYGNGNNIQNSSFMNNSYDIYIEESDENDIIDNFINNSEGILFIGSRANILNNNISNCGLGLNLWRAHENNIIGNNISYSSYGLYHIGIYLFNSRRNNIIQNQVYSNSICGINLTMANNNMIYHNNIIGNANQSFDDGNTTRWNASYPTGGNYWSDYCPGAPDLFNGSATPQSTGFPDGICDNQYDIDGDSMDYYPLKKPWDPASSPPSSPLSLIATAEVFAVNLSWNDPTDDGGFPAYKYIIYRGEFPGGETYLTEVGNIHYYNDTSVSNWVTYYYLISAVNILGEGTLSNDDSAMPFSEPMEPTNLTDIWGDSYVDLTWNTSAHNGGFPVIVYNIYRDGMFIGTTPENQLWYNDTGAANGGTYTYNVSANNSIGESLLSVGLDSSPMTIPAAPAITDITFGDSYLNVSWDPPADDGGSPINSYYIYRSGTLISTVTSTQTSYMDTDVINGITYTYNVSARNIMGKGPLSLGESGTPMTLPSVPQNIQFHEGDGYVNLTWSPPADDGGSPITEYFIYRNGSLFASVSSTQHWYNDTSVVNGVNYTYTISANNSVGEGPISSGVDTTPKATPSAPQNMQVETGDEYVHLTWDVPVSNGGFDITEYFIYRDGSLYDSGPSTQLWYNDSGVTNGVTYNYSVSAINSVGEGPFSISVEGTPMTLPTAPQNLQVEPESGYVYLFWDAPEDDGGSFISEYFLYRNGTLFDTISGSQLWYNDTDVINGVTYTYFVSAGNSVGPGPLTANVSATPMGISSPPRNIQAEAGVGYVRISWEAPSFDGGSPILNYAIYRGTNSGEETFLTEIQGVFYFNDTNVTDGQTYYYRVSAINSVGEGVLSVEVSGIPDSIPPNQPPSCSITTPTSGQVISGTFRVTGTAFDSDGTIQRVEIRLGDGSWIAVTGTTSWTYDTHTAQVKNGEYMLYVRSYDGTNYSEEASVSVTVNNPTEEPDEEMTWLWFLLAIIIVVALIIFLIVFKKRRREEEPPEEPSEMPPPPPSEEPLEEWTSEIEEEETSEESTEEHEDDIEGEEE
jgi:parallel beta-helix repeat protein